MLACRWPIHTEGTMKAMQMRKAALSLVLTVFISVWIDAFSTRVKYSSGRSFEKDVSAAPAVARPSFGEIEFIDTFGSYVKSLSFYKDQILPAPEDIKGASILPVYFAQGQTRKVLLGFQNGYMSQYLYVPLHALNVFGGPLVTPSEDLAASGAKQAIAHRISATLFRKWQRRRIYC